MFQQLKRLPFDEIVKFEQVSLVYKAVNGNEPQYIYRLCLPILNMLKTTQIIHLDLQLIKKYSFPEHIINPYHTQAELYGSLTRKHKICRNIYQKIVYSKNFRRE